MPNLKLLFALILFGFPLVSSAQDADEPENPGNGGPLRLRVSETDEPNVDDSIRIRIGYMSHFRGSEEYSHAPEFELWIPFRKVVAISLAGTPYEKWGVSRRRQRQWGTDSKSGTSTGDIRVKVRAHLIREREESWIPDVGARVTINTATGSANNRRFLDAPTYEISLLAAKSFAINHEVVDRLNERGFRPPQHFWKKLRVIVNLGFMAWQQGRAKQNDVVSWGIAFRPIFVLFGTECEYTLDFRGFIGYQEKDKPVEVSNRLRVKFNYVDVIVGTQFALNDLSYDYGFYGGLEFHHPLPDGPWSREDGGVPFPYDAPKSSNGANNAHADETVEVDIPAQGPVDSANEENRSSRNSEYERDSRP